MRGRNKERERGYIIGGHVQCAVLCDIILFLLGMEKVMQ